MEEINPTSDEAEYLDRVHQHLSVQVVAAHALNHFPTATTLTFEHNDDGKAYDIVSVNGPGGPLGERSNRDDDVIGDTDIRSYPEETIWTLDVNDDRWVEGLARDRFDEHHVKRFDIDLRAALMKEKPARD